ncbi:MAG: C40 family peptidase [Frankiaceae bacterium]
MSGHALQPDRRWVAASRPTRAGTPSDRIAISAPIPGATAATAAAAGAVEPATGQRMPAKRWFSTGIVAALVLAVALAFTGCTPCANTGARALSAGMTQRGKPYIHGAAGPYGYDCSGLVQWSFGRTGRALPRTATAQYYATAHIPLSALRPGDLIFFGTPAFLYHVAIYAGNGNILVARHTGTVIQLQRLWTWRVYAGRVM